MFIWDSEGDSGPNSVIEDAFYIAIDDENGALRIADYHANGFRTTVVGFLGPREEENAKKWDEFTKEEHPKPNAPGRFSLNCDTEELLKLCFGLG